MLHICEDKTNEVVLSNVNFMLEGIVRVLGKEWSTSQKPSHGLVLE
jgi:hypothetical protein